MKNFSLLFAFVFIVCGVSAQSSCESAMAVDVGTYTVDAVDGQAPPLNCVQQYNNGDHGMWYKYSPAQDTALLVTTSLAQNSGIDTRMHIYTGSCEDLSCVAGDDDGGSGYLSQTTLEVQAGMTYYIVFDSKWSDEGFDFEVAYVVPPLISFTSEPLPLSTSIRGAVDMNGDFLDDVLGADNDLIEVYVQTEGSGLVLSQYGIDADNSPSWSLAAGDLNADGYNDLVFGGGSGVSIVLANGDETGYHVAYDTPGSVYVFSQRSNMVDIDNDGVLDVFVCHDVQPNVYFMNTPEGFEYHQGGLGDYPSGGNYGSIWVDYDNDTDLDLFIAKCRGGETDGANLNELHRNNGDGTFTNVSDELGMNQAIQTWSSAWGDYDNDGDLDVFIGASSFANGPHVFMQNNGDGTFTDITEGSGFDIPFGTSIEWVTHDFDNDGYLDVLGGNELMRNNGDMTFTATGSNVGNGPVGDLNGDGFLDVVNNEMNYNDANDNNYLVVSTIGTVSNANGIGAHVLVYSSSFNQMREVRSGDGFRYMSSLNSYFGLGTDATVDSVVVIWPSGLSDTVLNPDINDHLVIIEGSSPTSLERIREVDMLVYPNPTQGEVFIDAPGMQPNAMVRIFDLNGRALDHRRLADHRLTLTDLPMGVYLLQLEIDGRQVVRKLAME